MYTKRAYLATQLSASITLDPLGLAPSLDLSRFALLLAIAGQHPKICEAASDTNTYGFKRLEFSTAPYRVTAVRRDLTAPSHRCKAGLTVLTAMLLMLAQNTPTCHLLDPPSLGYSVNVDTANIIQLRRASQPRQTCAGWSWVKILATAQAAGGVQ